MLLIDCGNSATKCRWIDGNNVKDDIFVLSTADGVSDFKRYIQGLPVARVYLASVASKVMTNQLQDIIQETLPEIPVERLWTLTHLGKITNAYHDYTQLGVDRWLTLLAAYKRTQNDVIIIDAGSAITIDLLSHQHGHQGGAILPGFNTSIERFKSMFPRVDFNHEDIHINQLPGRSTAACIQLEPMPVSAERIEHLVESWSKLLKNPVSIMLCGQDAIQISEQLRPNHEIVKDLVFQGMLQQVELQG